MNRQLYKSILIGFTLNILFTSTITRAYEPTEAEAREFYSFLVSIAEKKQYRVAHILVKDQKTIIEVSNQLTAGEKWDSLAARYSFDQPTKEKGGDLDWGVASNYIEPFAKTVRTQKIGVVSPPVQTQFGWHLIRVLGERPNVLPSFEEVKAKQIDTLVKVIAAIEAKKSDKDFLNRKLTATAQSAPELRKLIALGANVNTKNALGHTALHLASALGLTTEAEVLINAGARVDAVDERMQTPLYLAAYADRTGKLAKLLIEKGAVAAAKYDAEGRAPIHNAAIGDNSETIRLLIANGEKPDRETTAKESPLHYAAARRAPRAIAALLDAGADPLLKVMDPRLKLPFTPLDFALLDETKGSPMDAGATALLRRAATEKALKRNSNSFKAFVVQDQQRLEVGKGPVSLKRKPFTLAFEVTGEAPVNVITVDMGSTSRTSDQMLARLHEQMRNLGRAMPTGPYPSHLYVFSADDPEPGYQGWGIEKDMPQFDSYQLTPTGYVSTRQINSLEMMPAQSAVANASPTPVRRNLSKTEPLRPILLNLYIFEPLGTFEYAVKQQMHVELRWID
jgi:PPIC-type PPIASE domain/Ankyrin repeats (3 copies)